MTAKLALAFLVVCAVTSSAAKAETDWSVAAATWKQQLVSLLAADDARRLCGVPASRRVVALIQTTERGLTTALGGLRAAGVDRKALRRSAVAAAGGKAAYCRPGSRAVTEAQAMVATFAGRIAATQPQPVQPAAAAGGGSSITPVIDPDVALIRGCRAAVIKRLGPRSTNNQAFWAQYEACMGDQGAGWY
ncbi:MAG: hypothetical protein U1E62_23100 [Alsobacter sp.]